MGRKKTRFDWVRDAEEPVTPRVDRPTHRERGEDADRTDALVKILESVDPVVLDSVPLSDRTRADLANVKRLHSKGKSALRRARLQLSSSLRTEDLDAVEEALGTDGGTTARDELLDTLVRWRDRILAGDDDTIQAFVQDYPLADRQRIRQLANNAATPEGEPPDRKAARALFDAIKEAAGL